MKRTWKWCGSFIAGLMAISAVACSPGPKTPANPGTNEHPHAEPSSGEVEGDLGESSRSLDLDREIDGLDEATPSSEHGVPTRRG